MRIAYVAERFPSDSQTWIHHEVDDLVKLGHSVKVFATWPRPAVVSVEQRRFLDLCHYRGSADWPTVRDVLLVYRAVAPVMISGLASGAGGVRGMAGLIRDSWSAARLVAAVRKFAPDFIFAHFAASRTTVAMMLSQSLRVPFGFKMHAADIWHRPMMLGEKVGSAAVVLVISRFGKEFISSRYPDVAHEKIEVHRCGLPLDVWSARRFRPVPDVPTILAVGRLVPMKGFDVLLTAVRILHDHGKKVQLRIAGDGPQLSHLKSVARALELQSSVAFLGYQSPNQVRDALFDADLLVAPCVRTPNGDQDGIPLVLMEAMAAGVPVVSTSLSGIPELVEDRSSGLLCEPGSGLALVSAIMEMMNMEDDRLRALVARAREKIELHHDSRQLTQQLVERVAQAVIRR